MNSQEVIEILKKRSKDLPNVSLSLIESKIIGINTFQPSDLDMVVILCNDKSYIDPEWSLLAGRIKMEFLKRTMNYTFSEGTEKMNFLLETTYLDFVRTHSRELDEIIVEERDFDFNLFAVSTLEKAYLAKIIVDGEKIIIETPQYMYLRVATFLWFPDIEKIRKMYDELSLGYYSHASPTLFNAGMVKHQLSSCFVRGHSGDSMGGITKGWKDDAFISMNSGGLGIDFSSLRHSEIGHMGMSKGVIPWLRITNTIMKGVDQGGKRNGSATVFLGIWHIDVFEFIEIRDEGPDDMRAKDLFPALMVCDLFMKRMLKGEKWSLFCPKKVPLYKVWGKDFEKMYIEAEERKKYIKQVNARDLWKAILLQQERKGVPFMAYIDACNRKNNQAHAGMIHNLNLCMEIAENTSEEEIASCNLASLCLRAFANRDKTLNSDLLSTATRSLVRNLNQVIDRNYYIPEIPEIGSTNLKHRPEGIGCQGLADLAAILDVPWVEYIEGSEKLPWQLRYRTHPLMKKLNSDVFEIIYYSAVDESCKMAQEKGCYESFPGSFTSKGLFQPDLWDIEELERSGEEVEYTLEFLRARVTPKPSFYPPEWIEDLRSRVQKYGLYNSNLIALMPTASTAQIRRNNEAFEPFTELIYTRSVLSGQFIVINEHLVNDLRAIDMWNTETIATIIKDRGSVQNISAPKNKEKRVEFLKLKYRSAYEIPQKTILELSAGRGRFVCQTQSLNCFMAQATQGELSSYHIAGWKMGLKTGMYYKRSAALIDPINIALGQLNIPTTKKVECNDEVCLVCQ